MIFVVPGNGQALLGMPDIDTEVRCVLAVTYHPW